jgi:hypothetical protein
MSNQKTYLKIINQMFDLEKRLLNLQGTEGAFRNLERIRGYWSEIGYEIINPQGESYNETRTDVEASIAGESTENLYIEEVVKPIVIAVENGRPSIAQKGVVVAKSRS